METETEILDLLKPYSLAVTSVDFQSIWDASWKNTANFFAHEKPLDFLKCKNTSAVSYIAGKSHVVFHS